MLDLVALGYLFIASLVALGAALFREDIPLTTLHCGVCAAVVVLL